MCAEGPPLGGGGHVLRMALDGNKILFYVLAHTHRCPARIRQVGAETLDSGVRATPACPLSVQLIKLPLTSDQGLPRGWGKPVRVRSFHCSF